MIKYNKQNIDVKSNQRGQIELYLQPKLIELLKGKFHQNRSKLILDQF